MGIKIFKNFYSNTSKYNLEENYKRIMSAKSSSLLEQIQALKRFGPAQAIAVKKLSDLNLKTMKKEIDKNAYLKELEKTRGVYTKRDQRVLSAVNRTMEDIYVTFEKDIKANKITNRATLAFLLYTALTKDKRLSNFFGKCFNGSTNEKDPSYSIISSLKCNYYSFVYFMEDAVYDYTTMVVTRPFKDDNEKRYELNRFMGGDPSMKAASKISKHTFTLIESFKAFMKEKNLDACYKELKEMFDFSKSKEAYSTVDAVNLGRDAFKYSLNDQDKESRRVAMNNIDIDAKNLLGKVGAAVIGVGVIIILFVILMNVRHFFYAIRVRRINLTRDLIEQSEMILINIEKLRVQLGTLKEGSKEFERLSKIIEKQEIYVESLRRKLDTKFQDEQALIEEAEDLMDKEDEVLDKSIDSEIDEDDDTYDI